jgi:diacylglycerol kinase (ATP)
MMAPNEGSSGLMQHWRRILIAYNPAAGLGHPALLEKAAAQLRETGFEVTIQATQRAGDAARIAASAADGSYDLVVAAGGDGTINEVINGLAGCPVPFTVFPMGTANVLAAELGITAAAKNFVRLIKQGKVAMASLGEINGRRFMLMASIGFDAHVVSAVTDSEKKLLGKTAYVYRACRQLANFDAPDYELIIDGRHYRAAAAVIAKGRYYGGKFVVCPGARVTDPKFHVCLMTGRRRLDVLRYALALCRGTLYRERDVRIIAANEVHIFSSAEAPVQVDGDIRGQTPAFLKIVPCRTLIVTPQDKRRLAAAA